MSVYTVVSDEAFKAWVEQYHLGELVELRGIAAGITNTNYFVTTTHGRYVLTLFEDLQLEELPYYLKLMSHLARHGVACPAPVADRSDRLVSLLAGKPACLVTCLDGSDVTHPDAAQCRSVGEMLASLHVAGDTYPARMDNPRGPAWWNRVSATLFGYLGEDEAESLRQELHFQNSQRFLHLPHGVIHADLFRDNVLLKGETIAGFIDFYYACNDILLYDVAIAVNDWARKDDGTLDDALATAFLAGYQAVRPLNNDEKAAWPAMLRAGALRFWVSRLQDFHEPTAGAMTFTKDPGVFRKLAEDHRQRSHFWL